MATKLSERWSPEQVSLRLTKDFDGDTSMATCTETIYQAIYAPSPLALRREGRAPTRSGRTRRQPRRDLSRRRERFVEPIRLIHTRPAEAEHRVIPGHWDGDLILGTLHRSAIATVVDQATRYLVLIHLDGDHNADTLRDGLIESR